MGILEEVLAKVDALRRTTGRNVQDMVQQPSLYVEKMTDALRNTNRGVAPVASPTELTNRELTPSERVEQSMGSIDFGGVVKPIKIALGGPAVKGLSYEASDLAALQDALRDYTKPRMLPPDRANALASVLKTAEEPGAVTHVLSSNFDEPTAAFVTTPGKEMGMDADYLAHLVSLAGQPGTGKQALKTMQLQGPAEFISTPQSQGYYQKLLREGFPGLQEHSDPEFGRTRYMLKGPK
jgi:hypothetical protein